MAAGGAGVAGSAVDGGRFVAAAYLGVRPGPRPEGMDARYVREPFVDLAHDLCSIGPCATWASGDIDRDLLDLGVPATALAPAKAWIDDLDRRGAILHPDVCRSPADVAEFARRFVPGDLHVLGVALESDQVEGFLAEQAALFGQADGIAVMLAEGAPLVPGARPLGYEPVSVHLGGLGCSWTCNGLQGGVAEATGIVANEHGFLDTAGQADAVMAYLSDPAVGKEPGIWRAWLVVRYEAVP